MGDRSAVTVKEEVRNLGDQLGKLWAGGDANVVANTVFADDCCIMPPSAPITYNQPGAFKCISRMMRDCVYKGIKLMTAEVEVCDGGAIAIERGCYKFSGNDRQILETGKYVIMWKRSQATSTLKIASFIWNLSG